MADNATLVGINHVNLSMPVGQEPVADRFYRDIFCLSIKPKLSEDATGRWYIGNDFEVHLGSDNQFAPALRAHPAFNVAGLASLVVQLREAGFEVTSGGDETKRCIVFDPFGNRIELIATSEKMSSIH